MKEKYIELMERTLSAYTEEHIKRYFDDVKRDGLTEHGFPRLTSNIGILIAHGKRTDLLPLFLEMMEFCCKSIPAVKAANDFSVREIICCIREIEQHGVVSADVISGWKENLSKIDPKTCYNVVASSPDDRVKNWALFTGVSEFFRQQAGLCNTEEFIDIQLASQFKWLDENGMYMDAEGDIHHPIVYDLVPRGLFALLLNEGYRGKHYGVIDECLRRAGLLTLKMQSPSGEIGFGGRSNQFIHNEPWVICTFEYEARRYAREGNLALAGEFKSAIARAIAVTEDWLGRSPIYHIKNRFPTETKYGCEAYAYFDKYMITVASFLYAAYLLCDDSIPSVNTPDTEPEVFATTEHFHKLFLKAGGYGLEFDLDADTHYDADGLGRVHRAGAPSAICLSVPCPSHPNYTVDIDDPVSLSICPGALIDGEWAFAMDSRAKYEVVSTSKDGGSAYATLACDFGGVNVTSSYTVNADGVEIEVTGNGDIAYMLPALYFDGETYSEIELDKSTLAVYYNGYICRYTASGEIADAQRIAANRNGHYKAYTVFAKDNLKIRIEITRCN